MKKEEIYVRESFLYDEDELKQILGYDSFSKKKYDRLIELLKRRRILRTRKKRGSKEQYNDDASLLSEDDKEYEDFVGKESNKLQYIFKFVGVFYYGDRVVYVYPKYIDSTKTPQLEMKKVIRVLMKYQGKKNFYSVPEYIEQTEKGQELSELSIILYLLNDYAEHGIYIEDEDVDEINGEGSIKWGKTVDLIDPIILDDTPYYTEMYTHRMEDNEWNYCTRLHRFVLSNATKELENLGISDIFNLPYLDLSEDEEEFFGDAQDILDEIDRELRVQFDDRKVALLHALELYVRIRYKKEDLLMRGNGDSLDFFGTRTFHCVWEELINDVYKSQKDIELGNIKKKYVPSFQYEYTLPNGLKVTLDRDLPLKDVVEKPIWNITDPASGIIGRYLPQKSFIPDYVCFDEKCSCFYIVDAKYYVPRFYQNKKRELRVEHQPGAEDVAKQYLYYLAYKRLLDGNFIYVPDVRNCFIMPTESVSHDIGNAEIEFFKDLIPNVFSIAVKMLNADDLYSDYLNGVKHNITDII